MVSSIGADHEIWMVLAMNFADAIKQSQGTETMPAALQALQSLKQLSIGMKFGSAIETTLEAVTGTAEDAQSLAGMVQLIQGLAQMQRQTDPKMAMLADVLQGMKLENSGATVRFTISLAEKRLEQLAETVPATTANNTH